MTLDLAGDVCLSVTLASWGPLTRARRAMRAITDAQLTPILADLHRCCHSVGPVTKWMTSRPTLSLSVIAVGDCPWVGVGSVEIVNDLRTRRLRQVSLIAFALAGAARCPCKAFLLSPPYRRPAMIRPQPRSQRLPPSRARCLQYQALPMRLEVRHPRLYWSIRRPPQPTALPQRMAPRPYRPQGQRRHLPPHLTRSHVNGKKPCV